MYERFKSFTVLVLNINRAIHRIKTEEVAEFNLKGQHVSCLYYLYKEKALTAKELCDICYEDKSYISHSIKYLETNGFIECLQDAKKRYKATLTLTEKGKMTAEKIAKKVDEVFIPASDGLAEQDRAVLYKSLSIINDNLQKICNKYGD
ncbi:MAG: winged helix-turn-helix transcriptional regulator [Clostridia bacterium]|nr:winged helix-turn-helix transcriptional regulator [Clostridia bacterium]